MLVWFQHQNLSVISRLEGGESVAIVTDAGTPGVSDPGLELIQAAIERAIPVDPIPGEQPRAERPEVEPAVRRPFQAAVVEVERIDVDVGGHSRSLRQQEQRRNRRGRR